ncbi:uncharacterized protein RAG0_03102 [Rhynchosporium agropyri]|uniref:DUF6606 domain-containing protein n=1 Tax=Rhynchosporium agropyri TaxID=914238 RepID=A0A1E1K354_9HELO|nr:uncharacterized protein RAG0_03102 [Rhynchosporium agropyri]
MDLLEAVFNHIVLPPKLPGQQDEDLEAVERSIISRLIEACFQFQSRSDQPDTKTWAAIHLSLIVCRHLNSGPLEKAAILDAFSKLRSDCPLVLYIREQNAALVIRSESKHDAKSMIFEVFEASPSSESVLAAGNALQWDFPGRAVQISADEFHKNSFQESLAIFLEQASIESLKRFEARATKADTLLIEARDTTDPALISQMLMPLLEAIGSVVETPRFRKRVRDDVNIDKAEFPWRRLPLWLILRVTLQHQLCLALGNEEGRAYYKFFICVVLAKLLKDCIGLLSQELITLLKVKLCRRLAKLEMEESQLGQSNTYERLFDLMGPFMKDIVEGVNAQIESAWTNFKTNITRPIPMLPHRAKEQALQLSLPNSSAYLDHLVAEPRLEMSKLVAIHRPPPNNGSMKQVTMFSDRYFKLADREMFIENEGVLALNNIDDCQRRCLDLAASIMDFLASVGDAYQSDTEQMSIFILNLFDLWVQMDKWALIACPLLCEYPLVFRSELLDVLQLPQLSSMQRLRKIQAHLLTRSSNSAFGNKTIFSEAEDSNSFPVQYLQQSQPLRELQRQIETASLKARGDKKLEWNNACQQYDSHTENIASGTCACSFNSDGSRNVKGCKKCWHVRCRKRMKIDTHEDYLPENEAQSAAVIFELGIPIFFAAYRNATFKILSTLGHPSRPQISPPPVMLLQDFSKLKRHMHPNTNGVSLASAEKSFLQTHHKTVKMKAELKHIIRPLGLRFRYYGCQFKVVVEGSFHATYFSASLWCAYSSQLASGYIHLGSPCPHNGKPFII